MTKHQSGSTFLHLTTHLFVFSIISEIQEDTSNPIVRPGLPPSYSEIVQGSSVYVISIGERLEERPPPSYDEVVVIKLSE